jgi:hypothetical protein
MYNPQAGKAYPYGFGTGAGDDAYVKSFLYGQLQGISVFDVDGTQGIPVWGQGDDLAGEYSVYIKDKGFYFR